MFVQLRWIRFKADKVSFNSIMKTNMKATNDECYNYAIIINDNMNNENKELRLKVE